MKEYFTTLGAVLVICLVPAVAAKWSLVQQIATCSPIILSDFGPEPANENGFINKRCPNISWGNDTVCLRGMR